MIFKKIFFTVFFCFGIIIAIQAGDFNSLYRTGLRKLRSNDYDGALVQFKKAHEKAELSSEEIKVLFAIADVYSQQKKYKEAKTWVVRVLEIPDLKAKDKIFTYRLMIKYSTSLEQYNDALTDIRAILRRVVDDKDKVFFLLKRAKILELQKKYPEAEESIQECIKLCRNGSPQWQAGQQRFVIVLFKQKKYNDILTRAIELDMTGWETSPKQFVHYYAGLAAMREKKYKTAAGWFGRMSDEGQPWFIYSKNSQLGTSLKKLRQYEKAYKCFEIIYKNTKLQDYYRANGLYMMAEMRYLQNEYKDARALCEELKKYPKATNNQIKRAEKMLKKLKK